LNLRRTKAIDNRRVIRLTGRRAGSEHEAKRGQDVERMMKEGVGSHVGYQSLPNI
jgi:hypothetical protein